MEKEKELGSLGQFDGRFLLASSTPHPQPVNTPAYNANKQLSRLPVTK